MNTNAEDINAALEDAEQAVLRRKAQESARGSMLFYGSTDTFDKIEGGRMVVRRDASARFREEVARDAARRAAEPPPVAEPCTAGTLWYLARHGRIETVRVLSADPLYVVVVSGLRPGRDGSWPTRRECRRTTHIQYAPTWEEAHAFLVERATQDRDVLQARADRAQQELDRVLALAPIAPGDLLAEAA